MDSLYTFIKCEMQELQNLFKKKERKSNYVTGTLSFREELQCVLEGGFVVLLFSYFFYRSYWAAVLLSPLILCYRNHKKKHICRSKKEQLELQFKEVILSVQTSLQAGYSIENAFLGSYGDVVRIYGENCDMAKELFFIQKGLKNGNTLENLLMDLGNRCPDSEIAEFAEVYSIASKTGNQWKEVISKTAILITRKIEIKEEIELLVHGKKTESRIMCIIPFFILFYMDLTSKGYFNVLYHNILGIFIMTGCMAAFIIAYLLAEKITEIV